MEGNTKERTRQINKWIEGIALQGYNHLALVPVFTNVKARSLTKPSETWVNKALFHILHVLLKPETRKVISQTSLNTNDGIKLWDVIKTHALGDTETNRALAIERFHQFEMPQYATPIIYTELLLNAKSDCEQWNIKISEATLIQVLLHGLSKNNHYHNLADIINGWRVNNDNILVTILHILRSILSQNGYLHGNCNFPSY